MRYADCPTTDASVEIDAPAEVVWRLITDIRVPVQFSSELLEVQWLDDVTEPAVGARFRGTSHHPADDLLRDSVRTEYPPCSTMRTVGCPPPCRDDAA